MRPFAVAKHATIPRANRLHDDGNQNPLAIGCQRCPDLKICGGLHIEAASFSCYDRCCGGQAGCNAVCTERPENFTAHVREVGGFDLAKVPKAPVHICPKLPVMVPVLYGGTDRKNYNGGAVALPLAKLYRRDAPSVRFGSVEELAAAFCFNPAATIVVSGTDYDRPLERWWSMGRSGRRALAQSLVRLGIVAATSPNFSMFTDRPRHDDLHSAKRIAICWQEMAEEGLPTALHVNARTDEDWLRWTSFIAARPEVTAIAYEFATPHRAHWHATRLVKLAREVGRPLRLVVRGGRNVLPPLSHAFDSVTVLDTTAYVKTIKRQRGQVVVGGPIDWDSSPTPRGALLDELFDHNVRVLTTEIVGAMPSE